MEYSYKRLIYTTIGCLILLSVSGCYGMLTSCSGLCDLAGEQDSPHCYQWLAVKSEDPEECAKIPQRPDFKDYGSNPPKDKCYLMIAENTEDPSPCDNIEGGMMSYSIEECYENTAVTADEPDLCENAPDEAACRTGYANSGFNPSKDCGTGFAYNDDTRKCEKGEEEPADPECADPTFTSQCTGPNTKLYCVDGKRFTKECEFGCFEAECRASPGETDIKSEVPEDTEEDSNDDSSKDDKDADKEAGDDRDEKDSDDKEEDNKEEDEEEEEPECESDSDCAEGEICFLGGCDEDPYFGACRTGEDCLPGERCIHSTCTEGSCLFDEDCGAYRKCEDSVCVDNPCSKKDRYCASPLVLESCLDGVITAEDCPFGCHESKNRCMTEKEKKEADKEEEKEDACKEGYRKCLTDTTLELCDSEEKTTQMCEFGCEKDACRETRKECPWWNILCDDVDDDIEDKVENDIDTIKDAAGGKYMELLEKEIDNEKDPAKKLGLEKYKEYLEKAGETMDNVQTTVQTLKDLKRIFVDSYDPSMDIENMPVDKILRKGFFERVSDSVFGGPTTEAGIERAEAEDSIAVYEAMLARQAEIDFLKKSRMDRLGDVIVEGAKEKAYSELKDRATDIAEGIAGSAFITVSIADQAIGAVQDEAKAQMFTGLARAYNRRRADLEQQYPDMENEDIHRLATQQVQDMPYLDAKGNSFAKYGNLIENKDCQDSSNPLCIDNRVFWTAMDKAYGHTHRKELNQRFHDQFDRRLEKSKALDK